MDEMHSCMTGLINIFVKLKHLYLSIFCKAFYKRAIVWFKVNVEEVYFSKNTTGNVLLVDVLLSIEITA